MAQRVLFSRINIFDLIERRKRELRDDISGCPTDLLEDATLAERLAAKYEIDVPTLDEPNKYATHRETTVDARRYPNRAVFDRSRPVPIPATEVIIHVPFQGDPTLFDVRPSSFTTIFPAGDVDAKSRELILIYNVIEGIDVTVQLQRELGEVKRYLEWLRPSAEQLKPELRRLADSLISTRKQRLAANQAALTNLGIPIRSARIEARGSADSEAENPQQTPEHWDIFISHASEDKDEIARPLAEALRARGLSVWYDEFSLRLGDSLRRSIDQGLAHSDYGVVILSPHFFEKHWPQQELNGLTTREVDGRKVIIPIWHRLGFAEVREQSPTLADRFAAITNSGLEAVVEKILDAISVTRRQNEPTKPASPPSKGRVVRRRRPYSSRH